MSTPEFEILIDGKCPLCRKEAGMMRRLDRGRGRLKITDITATGFDAAAYGVTMDDLMGHIHGVISGDRLVTGLVTGMEVFRRAYGAVGLGWLLAPTGWPLLRPGFDAGYRWFARNRLRWTGRRDECVDGRCSI